MKTSIINPIVSKPTSSVIISTRNNSMIKFAGSINFNSTGYLQTLPNDNLNIPDADWSTTVLMKHDVRLTANTQRFFPISNENDGIGIAVNNNYNKWYKVLKV